MNRHLTLLTALLAALFVFRMAPAAPGGERDVQYSDAAGEKLLLDVYRPETPGPHPAVLLVHGGGWMGGSKEGHRPTGEMLARNGYAAFAINYRLAPKYPYPAAVDDSQRAVRWIRAHARQYDVDPKRIGALGDSAGGHLVSFLGVLRKTRDTSDPALAKYSSRVQAVVNYYGPTELVRMWQVEAAHRPLTAWVGGAPDGREAIYAETSPITQVTGKTAPHLIIHGTADTVVPEEQSHLLHQELQKHGVESTLLILQGAGHGWAPASEYGRKSEEAVLEFFGQHLRKK